MSLDWDWIRQDDGVELRVQTRGEMQGETGIEMGFAILEAGSGDDEVWGLCPEAVEWLRDRCSEWLARQGKG